MTATDARGTALGRAGASETQLAIRVAALQAAATFAGGKAFSMEVSTADVLKVAVAFERWLLEGGAGGLNHG
jgi:hypothetical protein